LQVASCRRRGRFRTISVNESCVDSIPVGNMLGSGMWQVEATTGWEKDQKHYSKKRPNELAAVMRNLDRYFKLLTVSKNSKALQAW